jgi:hypothetical protein
MTTLFAHMATTRRIEDFATDGLAYVLNQPVARAALSDFIQSFVPIFPAISSVTCRIGTEGAGIPDISVSTADGNTHFIENKFWSGLTDHQPNSYLRTLGESGVLLFIVPEGNIDYLWHLIIDRINKNVSPEGTLDSGNGDLRYGHLPKNKTIAITTWNRVLSIVETKAAASGIFATVEDTHQLRGLCEDMDKRHIFVEFTSSDLTEKQTARRILGLLNLVDDILDTAERRKVFETDRRPNETTSSGKDIIFHKKIYAWFGVWYEKWIDFGDTPLWLQFEKNLGNTAAINRLRSHSAELDRIMRETRKDWLIPIGLQPNANKSEASEDIIAQLIQIKDALAP